jgi:DNA-binding NarL/FixJ family response regulator
MMTQKKILIIEDTRELQVSLKNKLETRGFEVYSAGTVAEARRLAELHWHELDVVVLDMELDDPNDPSDPKITGADIGIEFRKKKKSFPPESLIYSSKREIDYYRLALRLGAAAYLWKEEDGLLDVVRHVRVLALRRALNGENPKIAAEVSRIAVHSRSKSDAIVTFCRRVLKPEFESCLGVPFVILFTEGNTTLNCADNAGLPTDSNAFYHTLQALAHGRGNLTDPFILNTSGLGQPPNQETALLYNKLNLGAFLPLSLSSNLRLSIGILHQGESGETDERELCMVLAQYLRPTVLENIMSIWSQWTELRATRTSTAKLCLSVGQEINDGLESTDLEQLENLADDLNDTGQLLIQLDSRNWQDESDAISVNEVIITVWEWVAQSEKQPPPKLYLKGDCKMQAQRSDLEIIFSRLLQWFAFRSRPKTMPLDVARVINIECEETDSGPTVTFEDNSNRLPVKLRNDLFAPFTQAISTPFDDIKTVGPKIAEGGAETAEKSHLNTGRYLPLYLAKMLVEGRYHGLLEDHSDEIEKRSYGHRIVMQFPAVNKKE